MAIIEPWLPGQLPDIDWSKVNQPEPSAEVARLEDHERRYHAYDRVGFNVGPVEFCSACMKTLRGLPFEAHFNTESHQRITSMREASHERA